MFDSIFKLYSHSGGLVLPAGGERRAPADGAEGQRAERRGARDLLPRVGRSTLNSILFSCRIHGIWTAAAEGSKILSAT